MPRSIGLLVVLGLAAAAAAQTDDAYTIKVKRSCKGDTTEQDKQETENFVLKFEGADGKTVREEKRERTVSQVYKETILDKERDKKPTRLRRQYSKAVIKSKVEEEKHMPFEDKKVLIEKKEDGKYHFSLEGGDELRAEDTTLLNRAFNNNGSDSDDDALEKAFFPTRPVKVNETWTLDVDSVLKAFEKDARRPFQADRDKTTATGKLLRAYKKDGRQYGVLDIHIEMPLKGELPLGKGQKGAPIEAGSRMTYRAKVDGCIDGTSSDTVVDLTVDMVIVARIPVAGGKELKMTRRGTQKGKSITRDLSSK